MVPHGRHPSAVCLLKNICVIRLQLNGLNRRPIIANTNLLPGYLVQAAVHNRFGEGCSLGTTNRRQHAVETIPGSCFRAGRCWIPCIRLQHMLPFRSDREHRLQNLSADSSRNRKTDSATYGKTDSSGKPKKIILRKTNDTAALKPKDKPVVQKDSSTNQSP